MIVKRRFRRSAQSPARPLPELSLLVPPLAASPAAATSQPDVTAWEAHGRAEGWLKPSRWVAALDVGKSQDPSAVAIVEKRACLLEPLTFNADKRSMPWEWRFDVRHLERLPLGMPYPEQVEHVRRLLATAPLQRATLVVDGTGVGAAVTDLFRAAGSRVEAVTITAGSEATEPHSGEHRVPKGVLVSRVQSALHTGRLRIAADLANASLLVEELKAFEVGFTSTGNMTFNARSGQHDDLVLSVALAVWYAAEKLTSGRPIRRLHV